MRRACADNTFSLLEAPILRLPPALCLNEHYYSALYTAAAAQDVGSRSGGELSPDGSSGGVNTAQFDETKVPSANDDTVTTT